MSPCLKGVGEYVNCRNGMPCHLHPSSSLYGLGQGLTLVHFSAQPEPCLTQGNTLHTLNTPLTRATQPLRAPPIPYKALKLS